MSRIYFHDRYEEAAEVHGPERALFDAVCSALGRTMLLPWKWQEFDRHGAGWFISLNTAIAVGNDALRLGARLHGQCEIHCYVEGPNRAWLAGIIEAGRESGFYRESMGWESVCGLLRRRDDSPVVTSYSVTEQFPEFRGGADDALTDEQRWEQGVTELRADWSLELKPENFATFRFGDGATVFTPLAVTSATHPDAPRG